MAQTVWRPAGLLCKFGLAGLVLALGLAVSGCGDKDSGDPTSPSGGGGTTTYTITFNANGGSTVSAQTAASGSSITLPSTTRSGCTLNGWYTASSGGTKAGSAGDSYTVNSSVTLYAQWTADTGDGGGGGGTTTCMITFNANGGSAVSAQTAASGSSITLPSTTRSGYTLNGWYTASSGGTKAGSAGDSYTVTGSVTLYAQWTADTGGSGGSTTTYTITFNANGGSAVSSQNAASGSSITLPSTTRSGYTLNGWYTASSGGTKAGSAGASYTVKSSVTLYAQWTADTGGSGGNTGTAPGTPGLTVSGTSTVTVTWTAPSGSPTSYEVYRMNWISGDYELKTTVTSGSRSYSDSSPYPGVNQYAVKAINSYGSSAGYGKSSSIPLATPSIAPSAGISYGTGTEELNILIVPVTHATSYQVYQSSSASGPYSIFGTVTSSKTLGNYVDFRRQFPRNKGYTYYFKVQAVFETANTPSRITSSQSDAKSFTIP